MKWQIACDIFENEDFQIRSQTNSENRAKMPFNHTSGRTPILSRFKEMEDKSEIELSKNTRISKKKGGEFVSHAAKSVYESMIEIRSKPANKNGEPLSEAKIVKSKLGRRSGYVKGMGCGVDIHKGSSSSSNVLAGDGLKKKLIELDNAKEKIIILTEAYEEESANLEKQNIILQAYEEKNKADLEKINTLQVQMAKMQQFLHKIAGISPSDFSTAEDNSP